MGNYEFAVLDKADTPAVIFRGIVGSHAYGTANAASDTDVRGVFVVPSCEYVRLSPLPKQVSDGTIGVKKLCYALRANAALDWVVRRETMPPTAFAAVLEGSPLSADETEAMEELLAMKARATHTESAAFHRGAF